MPPPDNQEGGEPPLAPSPRSLRGLDWFVFFVADVQTGFGPFVSVYLTAQRWTQVDIGLVLSAAGFVSLLGQMPGGALVDAARSERFVAGVAVAAICISALGLRGYCRSFRWCSSASVLHSLASCVLGPAMAAISLGLVGHAAIGERLGRNARFASIGNGFAAAAMGAMRLFALRARRFLCHRAAARSGAAGAAPIAPKEIDPERAHGAPPRQAADKPRDQTRRADAQSAAADLCRLPAAVSSRQRAPCCR